jgi:hypothetical protein
MATALRTAFEHLSERGFGQLDNLEASARAEEEATVQR